MLHRRSTHSRSYRVGVSPQNGLRHSSKNWPNMNLKTNQVLNPKGEKPNIPRRPLHHKWHRMHPDWMRVDTSRNQHGNLHLRPLYCHVRIYQNFPPNSATTNLANSSYTFPEIHYLNLIIPEVSSNNISRDLIFTSNKRLTNSCLYSDLGWSPVDISKNAIQLYKSFLGFVYMFVYFVTFPPTTSSFMGSLLELLLSQSRTFLSKCPLMITFEGYWHEYDFMDLP